MTLFGCFLEEGTDSADNDKTQIVLLSKLYDSFVIREADTGVLILAGSSLWWSRIKQAPKGGEGKSGFFIGIFDLVMLVCNTILDIITSVQFCQRNINLHKELEQVLLCCSTK